jgi:hypothetical protein
MALLWLKPLAARTIHSESAVVPVPSIPGVGGAQSAA